MDLILADGPKDVGRIAAGVIASRVENQSEFRLGVATGSSPLETYRSLASDHLQTLRRVQLQAFALDEYLGLPEDDASTYRSTLLHTLSGPLGLTSDAIHSPDAWATDLSAACETYDQLIAVGGIDLQILGIGQNGHIGFNEPFTGLRTRTHVTALSPDTRRANARFFDAPTDVPTHCITQGIGTILDARSLLVVAHGEAKAHALANAILGPVTWACPASALQLHSDVIVVADRKAGALLSDYHTPASLQLAIH